MPFITINKNNSNSLSIASDFSEREFHGLIAGKDNRNKISDSHQLDQNAIIIIQSIRNWTRTIFPTSGVEMVLTSTKRSKDFNNSISTSGRDGVHTRGIAIDFKFTGKNSSAALKKFNTKIFREKSNLLRTLLQLGLGGIGTYGPNSRYGSNFIHIDTRNSIYDYPRNFEDFGFKYEKWEIGNPLFEEDEGDVDLQEIDQKSVTINENNERPIHYIHPENSSPVSFDELVLSKNFIGYGESASNIKNYSFGNKTNNQRAYSALSLKEKKQYNNGSPEFNSAIDYPVTSGSLLIIPVNYISVGETKQSIDSEGLSIKRYSSNITVINSKKSKFYPIAWRKISNDPGFKPAFKNSDNKVQITNPQLTVVAWSRVRYLEGIDNGFIDISKEIIDVTIEDSLQGGANFIMEIKPLSGVLFGSNQSSNWESIGDINDELTISSIGRDRELRSGAYIKEGSNEMIRNNTFYEKIFSQNDLFFIAFEKLNIDGFNHTGKIFSKWYDHICLLDNVQLSSRAQMSDISVKLYGRSLQKVLTDDNSYFNPYSAIQVNTTYGENGLLFSGRTLDGSFQEFSSILDWTVRQRLEFIFNRISSIGYVPDDIFSEVKDKTEITVLNRNENSSKKFTKGVYQIFKLFIDPSISELNIADSSVSNPEGSILDIIRKVCQFPFVEFFTDTIGDKFYGIVRKPPFEQSTLIGLLNDLDNIEGETEDQDGNLYENYLLEIEKINKKQKQGSSENNEIDIIESSLPEIRVTSREFPLVVNISELDVISDDLMFSNTAYAWYEVINSKNIFGSQIRIPVPAIYFNEYAQIFGNRRMAVETNYSDFSFIENKESEKDRDIFADQTSQQLSYLVETNIHLPFTREGVIVINGDRRIKKGNYIYYRPTKELFYVNSVTNNFGINNENVNRTTTLKVSRGMVLDYVIGQNETFLNRDEKLVTEYISYFDIVDIEKFERKVYDIVVNGTAEQKFNYKTNMGLNSNVLDFFLKRRQFKKLTQ